MYFQSCQFCLTWCGALILIKINKEYHVEQKVNDKYVFMQFRRAEKMQGGIKISKQKRSDIE